MPIFHLVREVNCERLAMFDVNNKLIPWRCELIRDGKQPKIVARVSKFLMNDIGLSQLDKFGNVEHVRWSWKEPGALPVSCRLDDIRFTHPQEKQKSNSLYCTRFENWVSAGHKEFVEGEGKDIPMPKYHEVEPGRKH